MLSIQNLSKTYTGQKPVIDNLTLSVPCGQFLVIIGNNGSGKSTLLKCISGQEKMTGGQITLVSTKIAYVSQNINASTIGELSVFENMVLAQGRGNQSTVQRYDNKIMRAKFSNAISEFAPELMRFMDEDMNNLSGGQRQLFAMVMATLSGPELLLLDEHTSALDPKISSDLLNKTDAMIRKLKLTTIMVTHSMQDALKYGDRLVMLQGGQNVLDVSGGEKAKLDYKTLCDKFYSEEGVHA